MIHAIRIARFRSQLPIMNPTIHSWGRQTYRVPIASSQPGNLDEMQQQQQQQQNSLHKIPTGDVMAQSFGIEYATRSEEEGFGGIYGSNEYPVKGGGDVHDESPVKEEYDKAHQENEVKEQEKATHHPDQIATS